jgi:hypothetical protein
MLHNAPGLKCTPSPGSCVQDLSKQNGKFREMVRRKIGKAVLEYKINNKEGMQNLREK